MIEILKKELIHFFGSLTGSMTIAVFLLITGLFMWVLPDFSILDGLYASLDQLFSLAPIIFIFLVPAITMRTFSDERQTGNFEMLRTKPVTAAGIVFGKYFATMILVVIALVPTFIYYYSVYTLGSPKGNIDSGQIFGSYLGLIALASAFAALGIFASALTKNQIVAFLGGCFLCFFFYWTFYYLSKLPVFFGKTDDFIQRLGIDYHYISMSRGVLDTRDVFYFIAFGGIALILTLMMINRNK
ncbi:MAG TPA: ABC transporter permease [Saprospiraceae bacterium]|nr:ABC transporter permease [Saprospiraceae bacterium]